MNRDESYDSYPTKTRVLGLSAIEDFEILYNCVGLIQYQRVTDSRTDRRTDGHVALNSCAMLTRCRNITEVTRNRTVNLVKECYPALY